MDHNVGCDTRRQELAGVAARMREDHGPEHERHAMWGAMADWLDRAARISVFDQGFPGSETAHALRVARAYPTSVTPPVSQDTE